ncbi:MAG TPA: tetratricopeptide repeat protein [Burkholderiaceae bacterium]|nr:tetratricopeptide repeat protein [Burkholderiaceae bacterium]
MAVDRQGGGKAVEPLVVIALDGLDRAQVEHMAARGLVPNLARLAAGGRVGRIAVAPPGWAESFWTTFATGELPDVHGVLHPYELSGDSGFARTRGAASVRASTLWEHVDRAGASVALVGWPATDRLVLGHGVVAASAVEPALESAEAGVCPPPPELLSVGRGVVDVGSLRLHPEESGSPALDALLDRIEASASSATRHAGVRSLAEAATLHAVATRWLAERSPQLLGVRIPLLGRLASIGSDGGCELWRSVRDVALQWVDLLLGRYLEIAGPAARFLVVGSGVLRTTHGGSLLPHEPPDAFFIAKGVATSMASAGCGGADTVPLTSLQPLVLQTLGVSPRPPRTLFHAAPIRIASVPGRLPGRLLVGGRLRIDEFAFDTTLALSRRIERETRLALAEVQMHRGDANRAAATLRDLTARFRDWEPGLLLRASLLLQGGNESESVPLLQDLTLHATDAACRVAARALTAYAVHHWEEAEAAFTQLRHQWRSFVDPLPWLAGVALQMGRWAVAEARYRGLAARYPNDPALAEGLAIAQLAQGHGADALATVEEALRVAPTRASLRQLRRIARERLGQADLPRADSITGIPTAPVPSDPVT